MGYEEKILSSLSTVLDNQADLGKAVGGLHDRFTDLDKSVAEIRVSVKAHGTSIDRINEHCDKTNREIFARLVTGEKWQACHNGESKGKAKAEANETRRQNIYIKIALIVVGLVAAAMGGSAANITTIIGKVFQ